MEMSGVGASANAGSTPVVKLVLSAVTLEAVMPASVALYVIRYTAPAVSSDTNTEPSGIGSTSAGRPAGIDKVSIERQTCVQGLVLGLVTDKLTLKLNP